ncbi:MAG TPA: thioredoxin domain-containing protein, partial [Stellaceae bacterium]|nr:thioredoxin domain-containing protein [Stellaceae bacterium]
MVFRFSFALLLAIGVLAFRLPDAVAADFSSDQKKEIEAIVRDYLKNHPEVLIDAMQAAEDKLKTDAKDKTAQALAAHRQEVFNDAQSPVAGNPNGNATLVEFFDYRCPYCKQVEPALERIVADDRQLRFVYKEFPVLGPESETAARVALAAKRQGKYDAFHRAMMSAGGHIDESVIFKVASSV